MLQGLILLLLPALPWICCRGRGVSIVPSWEPVQPRLVEPQEPTVTNRCLLLAGQHSRYWVQVLGAARDLH